MCPSEVEHLKESLTRVHLGSSPTVAASTVSQKTQSQTEDISPGQPFSRYTKSPFREPPNVAQLSALSPIYRDERMRWWIKTEETIKNLFCRNEHLREALEHIQTAPEMLFFLSQLLQCFQDGMRVYYDALLVLRNSQDEADIAFRQHAQLQLDVLLHAHRTCRVHYMNLESEMINTPEYCPETIRSLMGELELVGGLELTENEELVIDELMTSISQPAEKDSVNEPLEEDKTRGRRGRARSLTIG